MTELLLTLNIVGDIAMLIGMVMLYRKQYPRIILNGSEMTPEQAKKIAKPGVISVTYGNKRKGSIFIPPTDIDAERERIIEERKAQGLDTPVDMLRERTNEE